MMTDAAFWVAGIRLAPTKILEQIMAAMAAEIWAEILRGMIGPFCFAVR